MPRINIKKYSRSNIDTPQTESEIPEEIDNNIFVKMNKKKYNPDIESKLNNVSNEREQTKFNLCKTIYNPITGIIPDKLNTQNDLILQKDKTIQKLSNKKIKYLLMKHLEDKNRVAFLRSKLKYGKVVFQLSYQYYKGRYLINTEYKPTLINQSETSKSHSYESIYDSISLKKDF
jgi:hypothetical protein